MPCPHVDLVYLLLTSNDKSILFICQVNEKTGHRRALWITASLVAVSAITRVLLRKRIMKAVLHQMVRSAMSKRGVQFEDGLK
jgi:hypothetical protein